MHSDDSHDLSLQVGSLRFARIMGPIASTDIPDILVDHGYDDE